MARRQPAFAFLLLVGLTTGVFTAPTIRAQADLTRQVQDLMRQADSGDHDRIWDLGRQLGDLDGPEDALVKAIVAAGQAAGPKGRLAAARALSGIADGGVFAREIFDLLAPLARSDDPKTRTGALALLGDPRSFNTRVLPQVVELLQENATSELVDPLLRVEACKALWRVGDEAGKRNARSTLTAFLGSRDRNLQIQGALALAELNPDSSHPAWDVLRRIQHEPTPEGRLAQSYVRLEQSHRQLESALFRMADQAAPRTGGSKDEFATLREILARVHGQHLQGDKLTDDFLLTAAAKGILSSLDKHSSFFTSDEYQKFFFDLNREYGGIGAFVNFDRDDVFSITRPIYSGPAYKAGLKSGDKILEVDGWETQGRTSDEIIARLKGKPGTPVSIKYFRLGFVEPQEVTIVRREIQVPAVNHDMLPGDVGYIELVTFAATVTEELTTAIQDLKERGAKALVLDVRNNTGGYLEIARDVVELFVGGEELVVYTAGRDVPRENYKTRNRAVAAEMPLAIVANEFSASASEIVAGAMQDLKRAVVVGKRTYGKGSVQTLIPLRSQPGEPFRDENGDRKRDEWEPFDDVNKNGKYDVGPRLKLTVARYHLPSGRSPNKEFDMDGKVTNPDWGVIPDKEVDIREFDAKDAWKNSEILDLLNRNVFEEYAKQRIETHKELLMELAAGDGGSHERYPDFDTFYDGLKTKLTKDDVRRWLRYAIRDRVSDLRGKAYPGNRALGDYQEDGQLQEAVRQLLQKLGKSIDDVKAYQGVLKTAQAEEPAPKRNARAR